MVGFSHRSHLKGIGELNSSDNRQQIDRQLRTYIRLSHCQDYFQEPPARNRHGRIYFRLDATGSDMFAGGHAELGGFLPEDNVTLAMEVDSGGFLTLKHPLNN